MNEQPTTQPQVIEWRTGLHNSKRGYVGGIKMFSFNYGMVRNSDTPWELYTMLPGLKQNTQHATDEMCKAAAERMLQNFLKHLVIKAGVALPENDTIDAGLDADELEATAQAIARMAVKRDDASWKVFWAALPPAERLSYRLKAQAAMKA